MTGPLTAIFGPFQLQGAGLLIQAASSVILGTTNLVPIKYGDALFWLSVVLGGISAAIEHAVFSSIASARVQAHEQGKLFTLFHVVRAVGAIIGAQTLCKRSFNAKWQD